MGLRWGYSPKIEKFIPLGDYPADQYLIIAQQAIENLGWKLSHLSESGIIAYTNISFQSYSEEISIRIHANVAVFKSECLGVQLMFTDYGKNDQNLEKFFHEFEYVQFQLKDIWQDRLTAFHAHIATQDDGYFNQAPLAAKNKIRNAFYLLYPQKGYFVTPFIVILSTICWFMMLSLMVGGLNTGKHVDDPAAFIARVYEIVGANSRDLVLRGQFWRLLTHQFVHFSFFHLFFNMYALIYIGLMIENKLGSVKTLAVYLLSGICGGLISIVNYKIGFMGGASGAIMGMFGAFLAMLLSRAFEKNANKALLLSTGIVVAYMLINGLFGHRVDNSAHFGGFISGCILGYLLYNKELFHKQWSVYLRSAVAVLLVAGLAFAVLTFSPRYDVKAYVALREQFMNNEVLFNNVYSVSRDLSKTEQGEVVKKYGIKPWEENLNIVKKMDKLALIEEHVLDRKFRRALANTGYEASMLMYKYYRGDTDVKRATIQAKINKLAQLKSDFIEASIK